jgi:hypothetical protein
VVGAGRSIVIIIAMGRRSGHIEHTSTERELVGAVAVGEEAIMSNAMEAGRQHVEQETPHELADVEAHDFALVITALPIVLPAETDVGVVEIALAARAARSASRAATSAKLHCQATSGSLPSPPGCLTNISPAGSPIERRTAEALRRTSRTSAAKPGLAKYCVRSTIRVALVG